MKTTVLLLLMCVQVHAQMIKSVDKSHAIHIAKYSPGKQTSEALISFHGLNGKYNDGATIVKWIESGLVLPVDVYAPQLPAGDKDWSKNDIAYVFKYLKGKYKKVHITGVSLGGIASFRAMHFNADSLNKTWPRLNIGSVGIVCGKDDRKSYSAFAKYNLRCWHGKLDVTCSYSLMVKTVNNINAAGGKVLLNSYDGIAHNVWVKAYDPALDDSYIKFLFSCLDQLN